MKHSLQLLLTLFLTVLIGNALLTAQTNNFPPDTLEEITVSGYVYLDTSNAHPHYFMDSDDDGKIEYKLNFGPWWYQPDSSNAARPEQGDMVEIFGGIHKSKYDSIEVIVVYEINDEFWRDPYEPSWTRMGKFHKRHRKTYRNHKGFAFGWLNDSIEVVSVDGVTLIDTTHKHWHYYFDTDKDTLPNYFLNFGPPWYEPASGLQKPAEFEEISITGAVALKSDPPVIFVFELNGETWVDTVGYGQQMGGGWIHKNMNQERHIKTPFDSLSGMRIRKGWNDGKKDKLPDSLFCQMLQLYPENVAKAQNQNMFAAFEVGVFAKNGRNLMVKNDSAGGRLRFANEIKYRLHYNEVQIEGFNRNERTIRVRNWNDETGKWDGVENAILDTDANTISFESQDISGLFILVAEEATAIEDDLVITPGSFVLHQNYPNPFNPSTTIAFELKNNAEITLSVFNVLGQKIVEVAKGQFNGGLQTVLFDASKLSSGTYFYQLKAEGVNIVKSMQVVR